MEDQHAKFNFWLTQNTTPRPFKVSRFSTVRNVKNSLRELIGCESEWAPQQLHYSIALFTSSYIELRDQSNFHELLSSGRLLSGDDLYIIIKARSGRTVDYFDLFTEYLRSFCISLSFRHRGLPLAREEPNHNYLFYWVDDTEHTLDAPSLADLPET